jgi:hypothetical protein
VSQEDFVRLTTFPIGLDKGNHGNMSKCSVFAFDDEEIQQVQQMFAGDGLSQKENRGLGVMFGMVTWMVFVEIYC